MIKFSTDKGVLTCSFLGRMDTNATILIEKELAEKIEGLKTQVIFDLMEVEYIASSFLRLCLKAAKDLGEDNFSIIRVRPQVQKVFKIAGLDNIIKTESLQSS
jgi:anti-anti-sigma factor